MTLDGLSVRPETENDPFTLLESFGRYYNVATLAEGYVREEGFHRVLSVGEGSGEYVLALAKKCPGTDFAAIDLDWSRVARAEGLRRFLGIENAFFCVADAARMPFRNGSFDFVFERSVFHVLPDKDAHLGEICRLNPRVLLLTEMVNGRWYLANWRVYRLLLRLATGRRLDLTTQQTTVDYLRRIGGYRSWRGYREIFRSHRMSVRPIWHDFFTGRSYHREFPAAVGRISATFGLEVRLFPPETGRRETLSFDD